MSTDTSTSFGNTFNVSEVTLGISTDVRFNIIKRREFVTYKTLSDNDNTNLAYAVSKPLISQENISATDKANELLANRLPKETDVIVFSGGVITLQTDRFLATDVFFTSDIGIKIPVYYKHVLTHFDSTNPNLELSDITLLDSSLHITIEPATIIDFEDGIVYNNLKNTFDYVSGDYNIYYIRYSVRNTSSGAINSYVEIINNQPIYRAATFDDLVDGLLPPTLKVYTIEQNYISNTYEITFPVLQIYAILEMKESRIHLHVPQNLGSDNQWFTTVTNGNFLTTLRTSTTSSNIFGYNLPEFNAQLFTPFAPFKFKDSELSQRVNNHTIKTLKNHIQHDVDNAFHILVVARNVDGSVRVATSTDPGVIGTTFEDVTVGNYIRSIDSQDGMIDLSVDVFESDTVEVSYYYEETEYEILDIDFNPIFNSDIFGERIVFYLVPNTNNTLTRCLYYLIVDHNGIITFTSQTSDSDLTTDVDTGTFKYDIPSPNSGALNFLDKYTLHAVSAFQFTNPTNPKYLVLSEVVTSDVKHAHEAVLIDVRKQGGGIKNTPGLLQEIAESVPEVMWSTNMSPIGGFQYPGNGATLIEVPTSVQKDYAGKFNDIQLRSIIEKHIGFGIYPILRGYSTDVICVAEPHTDIDDNVSIDITWRSYGADKTYNVYYSLYEDRLFTKVNDAPIEDDSDGNSYTITSGLETDKKYWVYVVACDTIQNYPQTIIGVDLRHTYELLNKVQVLTYALPS